MKTCIMCGKEFEPRTANQKYCGIKCVNLAKNDTRNPIGKEMICPICNQPFIKKGSHQKYCSPACMKKAKSLATMRSNKKVNDGFTKYIAEVKDIRPSRCVEIDAEMQSRGMRYADWQMQDSINRYGRVTI